MSQSLIKNLLQCHAAQVQLLTGQLLVTEAEMLLEDPEKNKLALDQLNLAQRKLAGVELDLRAAMTAVDLEGTVSSSIVSIDARKRCAKVGAEVIPFPRFPGGAA